MDLGNALTLGGLVVVIIGTGWQIARDARKDRDEQERRAREQAVDEALIRERLRYLEERDREHPRDE